MPRDTQEHEHAERMSGAAYNCVYVCVRSFKSTSVCPSGELCVYVCVLPTVLFLDLNFPIYHLKIFYFQKKKIFKKKTIKK
jgi:hypothetical protein